MSFERALISFVEGFSRLMLANVGRAAKKTAALHAMSVTNAQLQAMSLDDLEMLVEITGLIRRHAVGRDSPQILHAIERENIAEMQAAARSPHSHVDVDDFNAWVRQFYNDPAFFG